MTPDHFSAATSAVRRLPVVTDSDFQSLAGLLIDAVDGGASVSFMHPLPVPRAMAFWQGVADGVAGGLFHWQFIHPPEFAALLPPASCVCVAAP